MPLRPVSILALFAAALAAAPLAAERAKEPTPVQTERLQKADAIFKSAMESRDWSAAADALRTTYEINLQLQGADSIATLSPLETLAIAEQLAGRIADSVTHYRAALAARERRGERGTPAALVATRGLGSALTSAGRYEEAIALMREALAISEKALGPESDQTAFTLKQLGEALTSGGKFAEARETFGRALNLVRKQSGPEDPATLAAMGNLATAENNLGHYAEGVRLNRELLAIRRKVSGERHPLVSVTLNNLGYSLANAGDMAGAEAATREALSIAREGYGAESAESAQALNNLASILQARGQLAEAAETERQAFAILSKTRGPDHPDAIRAEMNLATIRSDLGQRAEAERIFRSVFERESRSLGASHPETINALSNLASVVEAQGRGAEAETLYRQAMTAGAANGENGQYAILVSNLATCLGNQGRFDEALALHRQALALREQLLGPDHPDVAISFSNIGHVLSQVREYAAADAPLKRAVEIGRKSGSETLGFSTSLNNYGANLEDLGRPAEAAAAYAEALAIRRKILPADHPQIATSLNNLGYSARKAGRLDEAAARFREALAISRRVSSPGDPAILVPLGNLAMLLSESDKGTDEALKLTREGAALVRARRLQLLGGGGTAGAERAAVRARGDTVLGADPYVTAFIALVEVDWQAAERRKAQAGALRREAFIAAQEIDVPQAAQALARTAARTAAGDPALAALVGRQQALAEQVAKGDARYLQLTAAGDAAAAQAVEAEGRGLSAELARIDGELETRFPKYRALIAPAALSVEDVRSRLKPDEGVLFIVPSNGHLHSFAIGPGGEAWSRMADGIPKIRPVIARLLCQIDPATCAKDAAVDTSPPSKAEQDGFAAFDRAAAFGLYRDLIQPVEAPLTGARRLYVSVVGSLGKLPLGLLPTAAPAPGSDDAAPETLSATPWLSDRYAITILPAVNSLRFASQMERPAGGGFIGYGAPSLKGRSDPGAALTANRGVPLFRGAMANPGVVGMLAPLPGTRVELAAMAKALDMPESALRLADAATEAHLKADPELAKSRVIAFATHGLLPGELTGFDEPGLVLTPPRVPSAMDDGVLSSSEIASLGLDADWVILSACNTAAASSGAESLSGLARAFLLAGARALLATHWRIDDQATARLTVETLLADKSLTRAEALQAAMRAVRTGKRADGSPVQGWRPEWTHPAYWASFSMISNADQ